MTWKDVDFVRETISTTHRLDGFDAVVAAIGNGTPREQHSFAWALDDSTAALRSEANERGLPGLAPPIADALERVDLGEEDEFSTAPMRFLLDAFVEATDRRTASARSGVHP